MKKLLTCTLLLTVAGSAYARSGQIAPLEGAALRSQDGLPSYYMDVTPFDCRLPGSGLIPVHLVENRGDFLFSAVKGKDGPVILAKKSRVKSVSNEVAAFAFFHECSAVYLDGLAAGKPAAAKVDAATRVKIADCMAVLPAMSALEYVADDKFPFANLARDLKAQFGSDAGATPSAAELTACTDRKKVAAMVSKISPVAPE